ncbi:MAG: NUDIX domain-containing protein [Bacteroidales bacterium]|nr:NUDIX domain-containing protein [Bacteroidales bacterium]MDE7128126.1 NUDIX domain-containing protein [Bacteroidales bacterium]
MFDLIYPFEPAPVLPAPTAGNPSAYVPGTEMFPVIKPDGEVVGMASRAYCHSGAKVLHPVVHLHIINRNGELYMQKRSMDKDIQPGRWDTAVGGHVAYGEVLLESLYREAREELGFMDFNPIYLMSYQFESEIELEMVNVFAVVGNFRLEPDNDEVDEGRWWPFAEIEESLGNSVFTPNFEQEFAMIGHQLSALL